MNIKYEEEFKDCVILGGISPLDLTPDIKPYYSDNAIIKRIEGIVTL